MKSQSAGPWLDVVRALPGVVPLGQDYVRQERMFSLTHDADQKWTIYTASPADPPGAEIEAEELGAGNGVWVWDTLEYHEYEIDSEDLELLGLKGQDAEGDALFDRWVAWTGGMHLGLSTVGGMCSSEVSSCISEGSDGTINLYWFDWEYIRDYLPYHSSGARFDDSFFETAQSEEGMDIDRATDLIAQLCPSAPEAWAKVKERYPNAAMAGAKAFGLAKEEPEDIGIG